MPKRRRANDFDPATRDVIRQRAGGRCSMPSCQQVTDGPGPLPNQVASIGTASHIFAASPNGPRGQGGRDPGFLASAENGIWLCATHGRLVDTNEGDAYPAPLLILWKQLQEARIEREIGGVRKPVFWIDKLTVIRSGLLRSGSVLQLAPATLLLGDSATGKSAIAEWLAGIQEISLVERWVGDDRVPPLEYEVDYYDPDLHKVRVLATRSGREYWYDGKPVTVPVAGPRVVYCVFRDVKDIANGVQLSLPQALGRGLHVPAETVRNLATQVGRRPGAWMRNLEWTADAEDELLLDFDSLSGKGRYRASYWSLSGSERDRVLLELAIELAATQAAYEPTILVIDAAGSWFDDEWRRAISLRLAAREHAFQVMLLLSDLHPGRDAWEDWEIRELVDPAPKAAPFWPRHIEVR